MDPDVLTSGPFASQDAPAGGHPDRQPEAVATAVIDFLTTALVEQPRRVGKPLRGDLAGIWSTRRGTYRVLYRIREEPREVIVVRIDRRFGSKPWARDVPTAARR